MKLINFSLVKKLTNFIIFRITEDVEFFVVVENGFLWSRYEDGAGTRT
jgi:hypothetical protein